MVGGFYDKIVHIRLFKQLQAHIFRAHLYLSLLEQMRLLMTVEADAGADEWVYGYPDWAPQEYYNTCVGTIAAGTTSDTCIVWSTGSGQGEFSGGYTSLSG